MQPKLTRGAARDYERIFEFGLHRFGLIQARRYREGLVEVLLVAARDPERFQRTPQYGEGLRRAIYRSHSVYFRIDDDGDVLVVRILGAQDPATAF